MDYHLLKLLMLVNVADTQFTYIQLNELLIPKGEQVTLSVKITGRTARVQVVLKAYMPIQVHIN